MSDLRPKSTEITLGGEKFGLLFTLNAIDEIQDHFDKSILELSEIMKDKRKCFINTAYILSVLINEDVDKRNEHLSEKERERLHVDEKYVARRISLVNYKMAASKVLEAFTASAPESEDEDADPLPGE